MSVKDRLKIFINSINITNQRFEVECGLSNGYIANMRKGVGDDALERISNKYPDLNTVWLLTGDGEMLKSELPASAKTQIRYWVDVDATAGGVQLFDDATTNSYINLSIPEFRDCTDAVNLYGDSMLPIFKSGQIIILKKWNESFIDFGNVYLIVTTSGNRMVKYIRKGSDNTHVLCVSENKDFDAFEIEKTDILYLYLVKGGISKNTL